MDKEEFPKNNMNLTFKLLKTNQKGKAPVEVILKQNKKVIASETAKNAEQVLSILDKILKKSKIVITAIDNIKVEDLSKNRYTSYRIIKSIKTALELGLNLKSS